MTHPPTTDPAEAIRSTMEQLLAAMVSRPEALTVRVSGQHHPVLVASCHRSDYGTILGKNQAMLNHLKLLTAILANARGLTETDFILNEDGCVGDRDDRIPPPLLTAAWDSAPTEKLASLFCTELFRCHAIIEPVSKGVSRLTVTRLGDEPIGCGAGDVEAALAAAFKCVGVRNGQRLLVELV